jgi:hypothetical protein
MSPSTVQQWLAGQRRLGHAVCLVLDSEDERELRQALITRLRYDQYLSVYGETAVADLADAGPFIFTVEPPDERLLDALLTRPQSHWGWLASIAPGGLSTLVKHWRERLLVGVRPHQALYRFHDNRVLARALARLPTEAVPGYLGPAISVCYWQGAHWHSLDNPTPGTHPLPQQPMWLQLPVSAEHSRDIRLANAHRYLLAEHLAAYVQLAARQAPDAWLREQVMQAEIWGWEQPAQLQFLLTQSLQATDYSLAAHWQTKAEETPDEHFERVFRLSAFWQGEEPL